MSKRKLQKFAELNILPNVYQNFAYRTPLLRNHQGEQLDMRGKWAAHFGNEQPLTLELACGKAEYTCALAKDFPARNFIAVDLKGNRLWNGAKRALEEGSSNATFLRSRIEQLDLYFEPGEVSEIWITFPDPYLKKSKANKRLTSPRFLELYSKILKPEGILHLKTDSTELYEYSLEVLAEEQHPILYQNADIYSGELPFPELRFETYYERLHRDKGKTIKYLRFQLRQEAGAENDV